MPVRDYTCMILFLLVVACRADKQPADTTITNKKDTTAPAPPPAPVICDTDSLDRPPVKNAYHALRVHLETVSMDWFIQHRQSMWRETDTWYKKTIAVDSSDLLKCLCSQHEKELFLYIPNRYYVKEKNRSDYFILYIINNSPDSVIIPHVDATINNIGSSVAVPGDSLNWLYFQKHEHYSGCGNSHFTTKLAPGMAIETQVDAGYLNMGDMPLLYRVEFKYGDQLIVSNNIPITLMRAQKPYLGKKFD